MLPRKLWFSGFLVTLIRKFKKRFRRKFEKKKNFVKSSKEISREVKLEILAVAQKRELEKTDRGAMLLS